jgi:RNA polymerase sigma factor (sigma-70 family)
MAIDTVGIALRPLEALFAEGTVAGLSDAQLLDRFLEQRDPTAFAALVARHGPMVVGVCRSILRDPNDTEDAFQATFLVLVRKAGSIRGHHALGAWLHRVAHRIATEANVAAARRRAREREVMQMARATSLAEPALAVEWLPAVHEEVARLPEKQRIAVVLCDLEGMPQVQVATQLCWSERTLRDRLSKARKRLRDRLTRRGLAPNGAMIGMLMLHEARIAVPPAWSESAVRAALAARDHGAIAGLVSASACALVSRMVAITALRRLTMAFALLTGVSLAAWTVCAMLAADGEPPRGKQKGVDASTPRAADKRADRSQDDSPTAEITVTGRATDRDGRPVAGATIFLVSTNQIDRSMGTTTTDRDGTYAFRNARLPISVAKELAPAPGTFQVYGTAPSYGFAWHGMRTYLPGPRPANRRVAGEDYSLFEGEPLVMDLQFAPRAALSGRVLDDKRRPIAGAKLQINSCDYLDTKGKESHHNFREFWSVWNAPAAMTTVTTDEVGHFRLEGVPRECGFRIIVEHPDYAWHDFYVATTDRPTTEFTFPQDAIGKHPRPEVMKGLFLVILHPTRRVAVRTVFADTGEPAPKVKVSLWRGPGSSSAGGITSAEGKILLRLPPGDYDVLADPTAGGADCIRTKSQFTVAEEPAEQPLTVRVDPGCVVTFEAVDAKTGKGVPGLWFTCLKHTRPGATGRVQSRTGYIDHPTTDANGRLRAVLEPGQADFSISYVPASLEYETWVREQRVELRPRKPVTVRFELTRP